MRRSVFMYYDEKYIEKIINKLKSEGYFIKFIEGNKKNIEILKNKYKNIEFIENESFNNNLLISC